ncbi:MAG: GTP cyclohydrolase II [Alphaproteobacteria bacterium]|nr:GTP cyclohydrolase II [Alphaproteobacteria bacterium]
MTVEHKATAALPTRHGEFTVQAYTCDRGIDHLALVSGTIAAAPLVRLHSECATGDIFASRRCDCRDQLDTALAAVAEKGGIIIYLRGHEGRGIGLANKIRAYALQDEGADTVDANLHLGMAVDDRDYSVAAEILKHLGVSKVRLLTNNQKKVEALEGSGIVITERVPLWIASNPYNQAYLAAKRDKMGHL